MHASVEQLLSVIDGEQRTASVCGCDECRQALEQLRMRRHALRNLPPVAPPADGWQRVRRAMDPAAERGRPPQPGSTWGRMAAAMGALVGLLMTYSWLQGNAGRLPGVAVPQSEPVVQLVQDSRALEGLLHRLEQRGPRVMTATRADLIASLEDRIALVDYGLSHPQSMQLSQQDAQKLWQERVTLMATLVEAHGVQFQTVDY